MHHSISHQSTAQRFTGRRPLNFVRQPSRLGKEHASKSLLSLLRPFYSVAFYSFFILHFSFASAQTRMQPLIVQMPDSVLTLLTKVNREDCLDFRDAGMEAKVTNRLGGTTELLTLTDDYALWQYTPSSQVEMKLLPLTDSTTVICLVRTVLLPLPDSHIAFYDASWKPLPADRFIALPSTAAVSPLPPTLRLTLSADDCTLHAVLRRDTYDIRGEAAMMTSSTEDHTYTWTNGRFMLL